MIGDSDNLNAADVKSGDLSAHKPLRIHFMDEVRGFVVILMVAYHMFYTAGFLYSYQWGKELLQFFMPSEPFFAGVFIVLCGISCRLSSSNIKRGLMICAAALIISAALWFLMPEQMIWFGILHFLGVSVLLFAALRPLLDKIPPVIGISVCTALVLLTRRIHPSAGGFFGLRGVFEVRIPAGWGKNWWLSPFGFAVSDSSDYFPLLPWFFVFAAGTFAGVWARQSKFPRWMMKNRLPFLSAVGRNTLLIYIVHQPAITAIFRLIEIVRK